MLISSTFKNFGLPEQQKSDAGPQHFSSLSVGRTVILSL
jgi:hypothetical protein